MYQAGHKDQIQFLLSGGSEDENRVNPGQRGQSGSQQQQAGSIMLLELGRLLGNEVRGSLQREAWLGHARSDTPVGTG